MIKKEKTPHSKDFDTAVDDKCSASSILSSIQHILVSGGFPDLKTETVGLGEAVGRVLAEDICAKVDTPLFDESTRDGFAVGSISEGACNRDNTFVLAGETGAGDPLQVTLGGGETWKVMTGGQVPVNCRCVVPQEWCIVNGNSITIKTERLTGPTFVSRKGMHHSKGDILVKCGEVVTPAALIRIANGGYGCVTVYAKPRVCFCCTGKELVGAEISPGNAQKISSNQYLLGALLNQYGCSSHDYGIVGDEEPMVAKFFHHSLNNKFDLVLSTGGTGGGAFDLVETGFKNAGGSLLCNALKLRPGKSVIAGIKGATLYIGLPGPPNAVHTVFLEIVVPLLLALKGIKGNSQSLVTVCTSEEINVKTREHLLVKEGLLTISGGVCTVRLAGKDEYSTCNILIPPGRDCIAKGEVVEVRMREPLWYS